MLTVFTVPALVLGAGLGGSSVAVAAAALIVVVTIVLVFVMVLRSNGSGRRAASGLGYDAQRPPLGQPQNAPDGAWQRPGAGDRGMPQPGWGAGPEMPGPGMGSMPGGRAAPGGWGQQDFAGPSTPAQQQQPWGASKASPAWGDAPGAGAWGVQSAPSADAWGAPAAGGWNSVPGPASRPGGASTSPAWDSPAAAQPAMGNWGAPAAPQSASPWDQPEANVPSWGAPQPAAAASPQWGGAAGGGMPGGNAGGWGGGMQGGGMQGGQMGQMGQMGQDWGAAPGALGGGMPPYDGSPYGDDKTRIARPAGSQQRTGMIVVRQGKEPGRIFEIRKDRLTIGRSRESDIFLEDLAVSRLHTSVSRDESGRFLLRDEGSANGTYVNGQRVSEQVLEEGDEVQVGQTVLAFVRR